MASCGDFLIPESTLALTYNEIRQRVGYERAYGLTIDNWTTEQAAVIELCLRDGSSTFYTGANYEWSFLTPLQPLTIPTGATELELPWDFGFLVDDMIYFDDNWGNVLPVKNDGQVLIKRQTDTTSTGRPKIAAVVSEGPPGVNDGQRSKLIWWPISDQAYDIEIRYSITPNALSITNPVPYGGAAHSQTILEACLAASERMDGVPGLHNQLYMQALELSKAYDRRLKPRSLGYNDDPGNQVRKRRYPKESAVTYTPTVY